MDLMPIRKGSRKDLVALSIRFIAHRCQRYPTVGDWFWRYTTLHIRISDMGNYKYNLLVSVHEQVEALLCWLDGVEEQAVTDFDIKFEDERAKGMHGDCDEPGDDPDAPYFKQHQTATRIERFMASELGVNWEEYDAAVNAL